MMTLKLVPDVVTPLPLTEYYCLTLLNLNVGKSGITSCTLKIGDEEVAFKKGNYPENDILTVDGDPTLTPTYTILPNKENNILLKLPDKPVTLPAEVILNHQLSYAVPTQ